MSTILTLTGSLDDVVFEGRNKAYGAFELRQHYTQRLRQALITTLTLCLLLLLIPLVASRFKSSEIVILPKTTGIVDLIDIPSIPAAPKAVQPAAPPAAPAVAVRPHTDIATQVVPDNQVKPVDKTIEDLPQDVGPTGPATTGPANLTSSTVPATGGGGVATDSAIPAPAAPPVPVVYAEIMPSFPGGEAAMRKYLQKHLRFPGQAAALGISGRVYINFVVQTDGSISEVKVLKGLGYGTDEAATEAVRKMPNWEPGQQNHHAVPVRFTLPITFQYE